MNRAGEIRYLMENFLMRGAAVAACVLLFVPGLAAQTTSTISGLVVDSSGRVIVEARVEVRSTDTGAVRSTVTGEDGRFVLAGLPIGNYEVRVKHDGFRTAVRPDVHLVVGEPLSLRFELQVGELGQEIRVAADSPLVNTSNGELSYLVSEGAIEQLPLNGRNYTDLALLQPGVLAFPHRDGGSVVAHGLATSINGQDPRSNVYLLDGTPLNDFTNSPAGSAAGTTLGMETIHEFRVEVNAYSAEFGRNSGGQINVITKSGSNDVHGSAYYYHRNDNLDARNFFDPPRIPEFKRHQAGATLGAPLRRDQTFFFAGYEALREGLGRTISTIVPDNEARAGLLAPIHPDVLPYLLEFPVANGPSLGGGLAVFNFPFTQNINQDFGQVRFDHRFGDEHQVFARYTIDDAEQFLPTDFPQFPRLFVSRNQFFTAQYQNILSFSTLQTFRLNFSRTRIGQDVQANTSQPLEPFVPGRPSLGNIDIGGIPRFGPQTSVNVQLTQNVVGFEYGLTQVRRRHLWKAGALVERYQDNLFNPTFSLGIFTFPSLVAFLQNQPQRFIGLTPEGELDRYWRFTLFGFYVQDEFRVHPRFTVTAGLRYEFSTQPREQQGRDVTLLTPLDPEPFIGQVYQNPTYGNVSPRIGLAWDVLGDGRTALRGGYGLYFNTNNQQNLIVTITNPPFTPRVIIPNPTFPVPPFELGLGNSIRPIQFDLDNPYVHVWNLSVQQQMPWQFVLTIGYAGSRGLHLLRNTDVNVPTPQQLSDGTLFFPPGVTRPNPAWSTIEQKRSDGNSWYNALLVEVRRRWGRDFNLQSSYTFSRSIDTTQASTFFSDATNGTTSAFPEFPQFPDFQPNRGPSDFHAKHNWVMNFTWSVPFARNLSGTVRQILDGWQFAGIATVRSGNPLTVFVQRNRSRSLWSPSLGPGLGFDRPNWAPGRGPEDAILGRPDQWFDPTAFALQPAGTFGRVGRGALTGPNLRNFDLALLKDTSFEAWGRSTTVQFRVETFNLLNRANFGSPSLLAFVGATDGEAPLPSFGRIRSTVTSSRQIQLGLRILF